MIRPAVVLGPAVPHVEQVPEVSDGAYRVLDGGGEPCEVGCVRVVRRGVEVLD